MATAAEQTALARLCADNFDQFGIARDVEGRAFLIMNIVAGGAFQPVFTVQ